MSDVDDGAERAYMRGGSLLLAGRTIAIGVGFVTQVIIVRSLVKADYGAFAYGLSIANLGEAMVMLGLDRAVTRFVPIFDERGDRASMAGTIAFVGGCIAGLSALLVVVVLSLGDAIAGSLSEADRAADLLVILVLLAPIQAVDTLFVGIFAVFGRPGSIFWRRFILGPGLRLVVVVLLVVTDGSPTFLATGYVCAGLGGVVLYLGVVLRLLQRQGIIDELRHRRARVPVRELLSFTLPLLSGDLVFVLIDSVGAIVVGQVGGATDVAALRAVTPVARLNLLALASFGVLFTPLAARRFARGDGVGVGRLYWQTAAFVAVVTFPVFALTFSLSRPVTVALFGDRYEDSAFVLSALALGYYTSSALGFNGLTLNVFGQVRAVLAVNAAAAFTSIGLTTVLVPLYGAAGAGAAAGGTLVTHNLLRQVAMARSTTVRGFDRSVRPVYGTIVVAAGALLAMEVILSPPLVLGVVAAATASVTVAAAARRTLRVEDLFPTAARLPVLRWLTTPGSR